MGIVISKEMKATEMGDRGSKSVSRANFANFAKFACWGPPETNTVKEQRVDGSSIIKLIIVRYTLTNQEI
jgi:hypothetical protein